MADKLRVIVDDIQTTIRQTFDDKIVSKAQVAFWVIIIGNRLLGQHITKRSSGAFLNVYVVPVKRSRTNQSPVIKGRKYIELPAQIFDFDNDEGVDYMAYHSGNEIMPEYRKKTFDRATASSIQWVEMGKYTKPSASSPYYWRTGNIFNIVGIETVPVKNIEVGIYQTISSVTEINLDDIFNFPAELLPTLKMQVTDLARYSFLFGPSDRANSGNDEEVQKPVQKIASVNQQQQEE